MTSHSFGLRTALLTTTVLTVSLGLVVSGQGRGGGGRAAGPAKTAAPVDITGYWAAVITKDWRWRMVTAANGDWPGIPLNDAGKKVAEAWDPAKDTAAGEQCRAFGAAGIMRLPTRLHITWQDDNTLQVDTDAGMQTRLLRFGTPPAASKPAANVRPTWQGDSVARWLGGGRSADARGPSTGRLEVVTRNMRPGYILRNGVPYSAAAVLTEYWNVLREPDGTDWLSITTRVVDPTYLNVPYQPTSSFKRERDGSKWDPTPCSST